MQKVPTCISGGIVTYLLPFGDPSLQHITPCACLILQPHQGRLSMITGPIFLNYFDTLPTSCVSSHLSTENQSLATHSRYLTTL